MKTGTSPQGVTILFYGVGGQGVLTAAEVCALAALHEGFHVKQSLVKGMAQRGGAVESYVRFAGCVHSPLPPDGSIDVLVCLHTDEYDRLKHQLKKGGVDLFPYLARAHAAVGGRRIFLNTYMLGVLSARLALSEESWLAALDRKFRKAPAENREFFLMGRSAGRQP